MLRTSEETVQS